MWRIRVMTAGVYILREVDKEKKGRQIQKQSSFRILWSLGKKYECGRERLMGWRVLPGNAL